LLGGLAGATPSVTGGAELGPVAGVLPAGVADLAGLPLAALPPAAVVLFVVRLVRADGDVRRMMWWPVLGVGLVAVLAVSGLLLGPAYPGAATVTFLVAAPVVPLSVAFGPVRRRLLALTDEAARLNADLAERVAELEASRRRLAAATEAERRRIERDLHDGAQQELLALITHAEIAMSATDDGQREAALARVARLSRAAYETVRGVSHGVRPAVLDDLGLAAAIRGLAEVLPLDTSLDLARTPPGAFAPETEGAALFFVSEALANVLKHGRATAVRVLLTTGPDGLRVAVEDDGVGGADAEGAGIRGLRDRVGATGGRLTLASGAGGTVIAATFPLPMQEST
jgi:signal transduction histidine kinase